MIKFCCSHCEKKLGVPDEFIGKRVRCTRCQYAVVVPTPRVAPKPEPVTKTAPPPRVSSEPEPQPDFSNNIWTDEMFSGQAVSSDEVNMVLEPETKPARMPKRACPQCGLFLDVDDQACLKCGYVFRVAKHAQKKPLGVKLGIGVFVVLLAGVSVAAFLVLQRGRGAGSRSGPIQANPVAFQLHLRKGDTFHVQQIEKVDLAEEGFFGFSLKYARELEYTLECLDVDDQGVMEIRQSWTRARVSGSALKGKLDWNSDSAHGKTPQEARLYSRLVGQSITAHVQPDGTLLQLKNAGAIARAILFEQDIYPGVRTPQEDYDLMEAATAQDVVETGQMVLDCALSQYPTGELRPGQRWIVYDNSSSALAVQELELTYKHMQGERICCDASLNVDADSANLDAPGFLTETSMGASGSGLMDFDRDSGLIRQCEIIADVNTSSTGQVPFLELKERHMKGTITLIVELSGDGN